MDPHAVLRRLHDAINNNIYSDAVAALNDYYQWRLKGGFEPVLPLGRGDRLANTEATRLADLL